MEEKIYKKQVTKQALAARVVDAQMPENQFSVAEQSEFFTFQEDGEGHRSVDKAIEVLNSGNSNPNTNP
jgi:hypothetical protein